MNMSLKNSEANRVSVQLLPQQQLHMAAVACVTAEGAHGICREPKVLHDSALEPPALPDHVIQLLNVKQCQVATDHVIQRHVYSHIASTPMLQRSIRHQNISIITIFR